MSSKQPTIQKNIKFYFIQKKNFSTIKLMSIRQRQTPDSCFLIKFHATRLFKQTMKKI